MFLLQGLRLMELHNKVECQGVTMKQTSHTVNLKNATKNNIIFCNVLSQIDFIQYKLDD